MEICTVQAGAFFCRLEVLSSINSVSSFSPSNILKRQGSYEKETRLLRASLPKPPATSPGGGSHRLIYCNNPAEEISARAMQRQQFHSQHEWTATAQPKNNVESTGGGFSWWTTLFRIVYRDTLQKLVGEESTEGLIK